MGNHETQERVVVRVIDEPDEPPKWQNIFSSQQFDEKTEQVY